MSVRLTLAVAAGFDFPDTGRIGLFGPTPDFALTILPASRVEIIQGFKPYHDHFSGLGAAASVRPDGRFAASVVCLPRARPAAQAMIWQALSVTDGPVAVDGLKSGGIDSVLKAVRSRVPVSAPISKAHGKLFWFTASPDDFADWKAELTRLDDGFVTAPGCFSADGPDPASVLLAESLPEKIGKRIADLGAGWGYLAARILERSAVQSIDLIEADHTVLKCARLNVTDPRARFHWADACNWRAADSPDTVVMNPPFHTGRSADPSLGRDFIASAARLLPSHGTLWMVANRHLPYETALSAHFRDWSETTGDARFKIIRASGPTRNRR